MANRKAREILANIFSPDRIRAFMDALGLGIGTDTPQAPLHVVGGADDTRDILAGGTGVISQVETTEPTAVSGEGATWPEADGTFWFQDPFQGDPHLIVGPAYNIMRFHGISNHTLAISAQNQMTKFDGIDAVGIGDEYLNITGVVADDELTVGAAPGIYDIGWHASLRMDGAQREVIANVGVELNTPLTVTGATNATPIVLSINGLAGTDGLLIEIAGVVGNLGANGSAIIQNSTSTTIELFLLDRSGGKAGTGAYVSGGELTIYYPSFMLARQEVGQTNLELTGGGAPGGSIHLLDGDKVAFYLANLDGTQNGLFAHVAFGIRRLSGVRSGVTPQVF
jgi:hypothetical protein